MNISSAPIQFSQRLTLISCFYANEKQNAHIFNWKTQRNVNGKIFTFLQPYVFIGFFALQLATRDSGWNMILSALQIINVRVKLGTRFSSAEKKQNDSLAFMESYFTSLQLS